jgi:hypothetical protein
MEENGKQDDGVGDYVRTLHQIEVLTEVLTDLSIRLVANIHDLQSPDLQTALNVLTTSQCDEGFKDYMKTVILSHTETRDRN